MINTLLGLMLKVVLLTGLGYAVKKMGMVTEEFEKVLSGLLVNVIFPISVIGSSNNDFSADKLKNIAVIVAIALVYYIGAIVLSSRIGKHLPLPEKDRHIFVTMSVFANTGFIGIPIVLELYGTEGMLYAVIYNMFYQFFFFTYGIALLSGDGKFSVKDAWNPCVKSALLALVLFLLQIKFPAPVQDTIETVGNMVVPLSMMIIGFGLTEIRFLDILRDAKAYAVSILRLLVFPALVFLLCRLCGVGPELTMIASIMSGVPSGSMNVIMAKQYGCDTDYATEAVVQSMLLCIVILPFMITAGTIISG